MPRPAPRTLSRLLLAFALAAAPAACTGAGDARPPAKAAPLATSPAPVGAPVAAVESTTPPAAPPPAPEAPAAPSTDEVTAALFAIAPDPAPPKITLNFHYLVSNEDRPQSFYDSVAGRGGAYVGVGAEQSFLLGGWARADVLFLMDFDEWVVDINEAHGVVIQHARTPDEVLELWSPERMADVKGWLRESAPDAATGERRANVFEQGRPKVQYRLKWLRSKLVKAQRPSFLSDQAELDFVAKLWKNKRVRCVRGDLTASGALRAFADVAKRAGWVVRMLYMSNAELYFPYGQGSFRDNLAALPYDDRSIVLHTQPVSPIEYYYIWQDAKSYVGWTGRVKTFVDLIQDAKLPQLGKLENGAWLIKPPP